MTYRDADRGTGNIFSDLSNLTVDIKNANNNLKIKPAYCKTRIAGSKTSDLNSLPKPRNICMIIIFDMSKHSCMNTS